jgi:hypothetical protein
MPLHIRGLSSEVCWDHENGFYWFSSPTRLNKALAHYELYKSVVGVPGDIVECGVYKAASLIRFATFRNQLENDWSRKIVAFDAFGKFPSTGLSLQEDLKFVARFEEAGGDGLTAAEIRSIMDAKGFRNISLVEGNVLESIPRYLEEFPATRIALLHLDMDVKEPTSFALEHLFDRVVPGGIVVFDDYTAVAGATQAVDEFLARHHVPIQKLPHYAVPAFVRRLL